MSNDSPQYFDIQYHEDETPFELKDHFHNTNEIVFVLEGQSNFNISQKKYTADQWSMVFINSLESHNNDVSLYPYKRYFMLIAQEYLRSFISDPILMSLVNHRPEDFNHLLKLNSMTAPFAIRIFEAIYQEYHTKGPYYLEAIASHLNHLFIYLFRTNQNWFPSNRQHASLDLINRIQSYVEKRYTNEITLKDTADLFNMDMYYLSHLFRDVTGFSFKEYLISLRISKAKELLYFSDAPVTSVCFDSGFNNINHFIRLFKKKVGCTPLQFRKRNN